MNMILFFAVVFISYHFLFFVCYFALPPHSSSFCSAVIFWCHGVPAPHHLHRPCEREGVRRLRHSLGCFSTLVPWAEKAPPPLEPLSLRSPDPTSWYSGLCPCLPGTVFFSSSSRNPWLNFFLPSLLLTSSVFIFDVLANVFILNLFNLITDLFGWLKLHLWSELLFKYQWLWLAHFSGCCFIGAAMIR